MPRRRRLPSTAEQRAGGRRGALYLLGLWLARLLRRRIPYLLRGALAAVCATVLAFGLRAPRVPTAEGPSRRWLLARRSALRGQGSWRQLAEVAMATGRRALAVAMLRDGTPLDGTASADAQIQLARALLLRQPTPRGEAIEASLRLGLALRDRPDDAALRLLLARLLRRVGRPDAAVEVLEPALAQRPGWRERMVHLRLDAASLLAQRDPAAAERMRRAAREDAAKAVAVMRGTGATPERLATMRLVLERYEEIVAALLPIPSAGITAAARRDRRQLVARALAGLAAKAPLARRRRLLERAVRLDPSCVDALRQIVAAAAAADGGWARRLRASLERREGASLGVLHAIWGQNAWAVGDGARAIAHLERALALGSPRAARIRNNLAHYLAHHAPPDLERAARLVEEAIRAEPGERVFRDTRGRIAIMRGRDTQAVEDLMAALPVATDPADVHRLLAGCYDRLGMTELAARHRARADRAD